MHFLCAQNVYHRFIFSLLLSSQICTLSLLLFACFIHPLKYSKTNVLPTGKHNNKGKEDLDIQHLAQSMLRLIPESMLSTIIFQYAHLNFSFKLSGVQQCHFEEGGFKPLRAFLGRFEVFVWGHLLRCVICVSVFVKVLGVLFLKTYIKKEVK